MDRYEVTNRQFKAFVDAGGYQKEGVLEAAVRQGRTDAFLAGSHRSDFATPRTDLDRPAGNWARIPRHRDLPVGGVSWYEAAAYAEFAGKSLPTVYEWCGRRGDRRRIRTFSR